MKALIAVMPKRTVLDPQGEAVREAIHHLGLEAVTEARVGKFIELKVRGLGEAEARRRLEVICHELLSNPVIEEYSLVFEAGDGGGAASPKAAKVASRGARRAVEGAKARAAAKAARTTGKPRKSKPKGRRAR